MLPFVFDSVTPRPDGTAGLVTCRISGRWLIVSVGFDDQVGSDLLVRPAASGSCAPDSLPGDLVLRNRGAEYFEATWNDRLFVDSGTGPDGRGLFLHALPSGERLVELTIAEGVFRSERPGEIQVWESWPLTDSIAACGHIAGMTPVIDTLVRVDLRTGTRTSTRITRCNNWT